MFEEIRKWWNTPKRRVIKCPVCESVFSDRVESPKEMWRAKPTDRRQRRIAYAFLFGSIATLLISVSVLYIYFFEPIYSGDWWRLLSLYSLWYFSIGAGGVYFYLVYKTSYHGSKAFEMET
jgi:hypothetical protein